MPRSVTRFRSSFRNSLGVGFTSQGSSVDSPIARAGAAPFWRAKARESSPRPSGRRRLEPSRGRGRGAARDLPLRRPYEPRTLRGRSTSGSARDEELNAEELRGVEPRLAHLEPGGGCDAAETLEAVLVGAFGVNRLSGRESKRLTADPNRLAPLAHEVHLDPAALAVPGCEMAESERIDGCVELLAKAPEEVAVELGGHAFGVVVGA